MTSLVDDLLKVSELRRAIKDKFTAKKLLDQGLERDLTQIYKPLTESQSKNTSDVITHLSNLSNESNKKLIDFKDTFQNFPDLIASIDQVKSLLDIKSTEIINKLQAKNPEVDAEIAELDHETREFEDALSDLASEAVVDEAAVIKKRRSGIKKERADVKKSLESNAYSNILAASESSNWREGLPQMLSDEDFKNDLIKYVELNSSTVNLRNNPWRRIGTVDSQFFEQLKTVRHSKIGKGVHFLPDNKKDLTRELLRLIGSYKSGNKNVYNELCAVVDQLRRKGVLSIEQAKKIYKTIS